MEYYVSGVKADAKGNCEICDDAEANFWTLYERSDNGESQAIVDCTSRDEAEAVMSVYVDRDALQQQVNALAAEERRILIVNIESIKAQWMAEGAHKVAVAIKACEDEFPQASLDIVQECALIADNTAEKLRAGEPGGDHA